MKHYDKLISKDTLDRLEKNIGNGRILIIGKVSCDMHVTGILLPCREEPANQLHLMNLTYHHRS